MTYEDLPPELREQIIADEVADAVAMEWVSVRNFAHSRKIQPQLVYYYIRRGQITQQPCPCCGASVISRKEATELFDGLAEKARLKRGGVANGASQ